jgi:hypothetical protein
MEIPHRGRTIIFVGIGRVIIQPIVQTLKPEMIKVGRRHAAMKNNAHETIIKRYVVQDSRSLTLALERSNSAAAISQAASGSPAPTINIRIEDCIARVKCIATSGVWLPFAAIKIRQANNPIALRKISAVANLCPMCFAPLLALLINWH